MSEIRNLQWAWVDRAKRRVDWPDSKTGGMSKPMSAEAVRLFETAPRFEASPYVCPSIWIPTCRCRSRPTTTAGGAFSRTPGFRTSVRMASGIARRRTSPFGIPLKIGMVLTPIHRYDVHALRSHRGQSGKGGSRRCSAPTPGPDWRRRGCSGSRPGTRNDPRVAFHCT